MAENLKALVVSQDNRIPQTLRADKQSLMLSVYQKKLLLLLISRINKDTQSFATEEISFSDYCNILNVPVGGKTNKIIKDSIIDLCNKNFIFDTAPGLSQVFCWIEPSDTEIDWNKKVIRTKLGRKLQPYYLGLSELFTSFQLGFAINFKSKYSYRVYEYLRSYANQGIITIKVENAYEILADNKYTVFADFERKVVKKAIGEINEFSDINVKYSLIKNKNKTTHITFVIHMRPESELEAIRATWQSDDTAEIQKPKEIGKMIENDVYIEKEQPVGREVLFSD